MKRAKSFLRLWAASLAVVLFVTGAANAEVILGLSYPIEEFDFSAQHLDRLEVRDFRFGGANWKNVERTQGEYDWSVLDQEIRWALEHNLSGMMTIASDAPGWACDPEKLSDKGCVPRNMGDFVRFVDELVEHLAEQRTIYSVLPLHAIQFGNEWPRGPRYPGTQVDYVTQMNIVYTAVKSRIPAARVVLGGLGSGHLNEVAFCEGYVQSYGGADRERFCAKEDYLTFRGRIDFVFEHALYDVVDQHLYWNAEEWPAWIGALKNEVIPTDRAGMPVVVSEFGGPNAEKEPLNETYQAARMVEYLDTVLALDIERAYMFSLVEARDGIYGFSGLINRDKYEEGNHSPEKLTYWRFLDFSSTRTRVAPQISIVDPQPDSPIYAADPITLSAAAFDNVDGDIGSGVLWTSDLDGVLGTGDPLVTNLSFGTHLLTVSVKNSRGVRGYDLVKVSTLNRAPVAEDQFFEVTSNEPIQGQLRFEDDGVPGTYSVIITGEPRHGSVEATVDGLFLYTPEPGYTGPDSFFWKVDDGHTFSNRAEASFDVNGVPIANGQNRRTLRNEPVSVRLDYDDDFGGGPYTFTIAQQPAHGTVEEDETGVALYTPGPGFSGEDSFTWYVNDGRVDSNTAEVTVWVNAVPVAIDQDVETSRDGSVLIQLSMIDDGSPGPFTVTIARQPGRGSLHEVALGVYRYTPNGSFVNNDDFSWEVNDGWKTSNRALVTIRAE